MGPSPDLQADTRKAPGPARAFIAVTLLQAIVFYLTKGSTLEWYQWIFGLSFLAVIIVGAWRRWRPVWVLVVIGGLVTLVTAPFEDLGDGRTWLMIGGTALNLILLGTPSSRRWFWERPEKLKEARPPVEVAAGRARGLIFLIIGLVAAMFLLMVCGAFIAAGR